MNIDEFFNGAAFLPQLRPNPCWEDFDSLLKLLAGEHGELFLVDTHQEVPRSLEWDRVSSLYLTACIQNGYRWQYIAIEDLCKIRRKYKGSIRLNESGLLKGFKEHKDDLRGLRFCHTLESHKLKGYVYGPKGWIEDIFLSSTEIIKVNSQEDPGEL